MKNAKYLLLLVLLAISFQSCSDDDSNENTVDQTEVENHEYEFYITEGIHAGKNFVGTIENGLLLPLHENYPEENKKKLSLDFNGVNNFNTFINVILENDDVLALGNSQSSLENSFVTISFLDNGNYPVFRSQSGVCEIENMEVYTSSLGYQTASYTLTFEGFFRQINYVGNTADTPVIKMNGKIIAKKTTI